MRKVLGVLTLLLGAVLVVWIGYNLLIERQPEASGRTPLPALLLVAGFFYQGTKWLRAPRTGPIVIERHIAVSADRAFDAYVRRMGEWWPATHTRDPASFTGVIVEGEVGGRIHATFRAGRDDDWGKLDTYDPQGHTLAYSFTLAQPPDLPPSRIEVVFTDDRHGGCVLRFAHGGWNDANAVSRAKFREWPMILDRFAALATRAEA
jgi:uncharacterized protein YndB with AHSA1/START domain